MTKVRAIVLTRESRLPSTLFTIASQTQEGDAVLVSKLEVKWTYYNFDDLSKVGGEVNAEVFLEITYDKSSSCSGAELITVGTSKVSVVAGKKGFVSNSLFLTKYFTQFCDTISISVWEDDGGEPFGKV